MYKVTVSTIFGLLGFVVNFYTINFAFPPYTAVVLIGLLFPMLITLAWGWKYGLLSALVGGCQSMWWLWGPSNGYATFLVVPPFTLWIVWHGLFANLRRKQDRKWWLNAYAVEVPFRILGTINLYTLGRWAITLNPPPWNWASGAPNTIPMHFSNFVVIKQAIVGYVILLLADVLLNLGFVRRFFKLQEDYNQTNTGYITSASLLLGTLFWLVDSVLGSLIFHPESSFLDLLALNIPPYEVYVRTFFILACLAGGLLASKLLRTQRESDRALWESEIRLSQIVEGSSTPMFVIDAKHTVTHWNKACENLTGISASEMIGTHKQWSPFYSVERPVLADITVDELAEQGMDKYYGGKYQKSVLIKGAYEVEDFLPSFGDKWLFLTAATLRDSQGKVIGAVETLRDITERKRAEAELKQTLAELADSRTAALNMMEDAEETRKKAERANIDLRKEIAERVRIEAELARSNADLEQFAYVASHDLQEPLRMVSSYVQLLARRYKGRLDADADDFIAYAVDGANRMQTLINDLLPYSRVGTRGKPFEPADCKAILDRVLANLQVAIEKSGAVVTHDDLPTVMADSPQLEQLFQNLIGNAIKFHGAEPPRVHVSAKKTSKVSETLKVWLFSVRDNGIGIAPEFFERIFIIFQRLHGREEYPGTGIGLALCKKIVERHGGRIWVESQPGKGAVFFFTIPIKESKS